MGEYEKWNPLLREVSAYSPESLRLFAEVVDGVFSQRGLEIGSIGKDDGNLTWSVSNASPLLNLEDRQEAERECLKSLLSDAEGWKEYLKNGLVEDEKTKEVHVLKDRKLVVSFRVPNVTSEMVDQLRELYIDYRLWGSQLHFRDGVDVDDPHIYVDAGLKRLEERVAGRFVGDSYDCITETAMWFSTEKKDVPKEKHWLYDADDVLVELRVSPTQEFMDTAEMVVQMGHIFSGKEEPDMQEIFLDIWHTLLPKLVDEYLVKNDRLPSQQKIFNKLMTHSLLPYFDEEYAEVNNFRPYNSMIFGPKGTGKTMLAAMLSLTRFEGGVVIPVSQQFLLKDEMDIVYAMETVEERTGIKVVPILEDLDALASLSSDGDEGAGAKMANSDIANMLAGMGEQRLLVIGIGNNPELMDPNLLDPERLGGMLFYLGLPDDDERSGLIRSLAEGKQLDEKTCDSLVEYLTPKTKDFSHRMVVDVFNRTVPEAAEARIEGAPAPEDFRDITEKLTQDVLDEALEYCKQKHNFDNLRKTEKKIKKWFKNLGYRPEGTLGFGLPGTKSTDKK